MKTHYESIRERALKAKDLFEELYKEELVFKPLLDWAQNPSFAGDRQHLNPDLFRSVEQNRKAGPGFLPPVSRLAALHQEFLSRKIAPPKSKTGLRGFLRKIVPGGKS